MERDALLSLLNMERQEQEEDTTDKNSEMEEEDFLRESVKESRDWADQCSEIEEEDSLLESKEDTVEVSVTEDEKEAQKEEEVTLSEVEEVGPEKGSKEQRSLRHKVEALEDLARGMIHMQNNMKKLESVCVLCEEGTEDYKYGPIQRKDRVAALEELATKLLEWKKPDEALGMQKTQVDGYNSLVEERHLAMKYHGLDVEHSDVECKK